DKTSGDVIELQNGAVFSGFTVNNVSAGMTNSAIALSCTNGTVTVKGVTLDGSSASNTIPTGISVGGLTMNNCTGTFDQLTIDDFNTGILIDTMGSPNVTHTTVHNT